MLFKEETFFWSVTAVREFTACAVMDSTNTRWEKLFQCHGKFRSLNQTRCLIIRRCSVFRVSVGVSDTGAQQGFTFTDKYSALFVVNNTTHSRVKSFLRGTYTYVVLNHPVSVFCLWLRVSKQVELVGQYLSPLDHPDQDFPLSPSLQ